MNPIENLWNLLKDNVAKRKPKDMEDLKRIIREEWLKFDESVILESLISSMPRRIRELYRVKGQRTKY